MMRQASMDLADRNNSSTGGGMKKVPVFYSNAQALAELRARVGYVRFPCLCFVFWFFGGGGRLNAIFDTEVVIVGSSK